jgi:hypothetical protein
MFMAGKITTGALVASMVAPKRVSASPKAALLITLAVAGAMMKTSAQSAKDMWGIFHPRWSLKKSSSIQVFLPVNVERDKGVTKEEADRVIITSISLLYFINVLTTSGILYADIPPEIPKRTFLLVFHSSMIFPF